MTLKKMIDRIVKGGTGMIATVLAVALMALAMPVNTVKAAADPENAEKVLLKKAEKLAVDYAMQGYINEYNYELYDINNDDIPELLCKFIGDMDDPGKITDQTNLSIYAYKNGKAKLLKTFTNIEGIKANDNMLILNYNIFETTDEGWGVPVEYRYEAYTLTSKGKLKTKAVYRADLKAEDGAFYRNDKEISSDKFWNYTEKFNFYEDVYIGRTSEKANDIVTFNTKAKSCDLLLAFYSYQWMLLNEAEPLKTTYTATLEKFTDLSGNKTEPLASIIVTRDELEGVDIFGFGDGEPVAEKKLGKFDLANLALLDTESVEYVETVEISDNKYNHESKIMFKTTLRPSNAGIVLPGFEYPGDRDVQGYNLLGTYTLDSSTGVLTARFDYSQKALEGEHATGLLIPLAVYTFKAE